MAPRAPTIKDCQECLETAVGNLQGDMIGITATLQQIIVYRYYHYRQQGRKSNIIMATSQPTVRITEETARTPQRLQPTCPAQQHQQQWLY